MWHNVLASSFLLNPWSSRPTGTPGDNAKKMFFSSRERTTIGLEIFDMWHTISSSVGTAS
eukprot:6461774-Amphidinium_carterae.1